MRQLITPRHDTAVEVVQTVCINTEFDEFDRCELRTHSAFAVDDNVPVCGQGSMNGGHLGVRSMQVTTAYADLGMLGVRTNIEKKRRPSVAPAFKKFSDGKMVKHTRRAVFRGF